VIFVGDVRSLALEQTFQTAVALSQSADSTALDEVAKRVEQALRGERELIVGPGFFEDLARRQPAIADVEIQLKRGRTVNELIQFRYDVTLHVGSPGPVIQPRWHAWQPEQSSLDAVRQILRDSPEAVGFTGIPNRRVAVAVSAAQLVDTRRARQTVADVRARESIDAVDPEDLWSLGQQHHRRVSIRPSVAAPGDFDAVIFGQSDSRSRVVWPARWPPPHTNTPLVAAFDDGLADALRAHAATRPPHFMLPNSFVMLDALPHTPSGKLDRHALPAPTGTVPASTARHTTPPRDALERQLVDLWEEVLDVRPVGVADDFFDLGGHSLLAVRLAALVQRRFECRIPLSQLLAGATVERLAAVMRGLSAEGELSTRVTLRASTAWQRRHRYLSCTRPAATCCAMSIWRANSVRSVPSTLWNRRHCCATPARPALWRTWPLCT
jgi:acyl carrier protein